MKLLHIDSSILAENSISRALTAEVVERQRGSNPGLEVIHRDLVTAPVPHFTPSQQADQADGTQVLEEFLGADIVVIGAPMYNFSVPSQLKAWIDRILVAGQTFRYSAAGVEGLAADKRVIIVVSRGGFYGSGTPSAAAEHVETYLRAVFAFIGISNPEIILAEGLQVGAEQRSAALEGARRSIAALTAA